MVDRLMQSPDGAALVDRIQQGHERPVSRETGRGGARWPEFDDKLEQHPLQPGHGPRSCSWLIPLRQHGGRRVAGRPPPPAPGRSFAWDRASRPFQAPPGIRDVRSPGPADWTQLLLLRELGGQQDSNARQLLYALRLSPSRAAGKVEQALQLACSTWAGEFLTGREGMSHVQPLHRKRPGHSTRIGGGPPAASRIFLPRPVIQGLEVPSSGGPGAYSPPGGPPPRRRAKGRSRRPGEVPSPPAEGAGSHRLLRHLLDQFT